MGALSEAAHKTNEIICCVSCHTKTKCATASHEKLLRANSTRAQEKICSQ